jgi:hypothetical protein
MVGEKESEQLSENQAGMGAGPIFSFREMKNNPANTNMPFTISSSSPRR